MPLENELSQEELDLLEESTEELRCNCNDEYITQPCPVHGGRLLEEPATGNIYTMTLSDDDLAHAEASHWLGHTFICKSCGREIMYDMHFCPNCGNKVEVLSRTVTDLLRRKQSLRPSMSI